MKTDIAGTTVLEGKKTSVLVVMPGLVDRSWSRTIPTLFLEKNSVPLKFMSYRNKGISNLTSFFYQIWPNMIKYSWYNTRKNRFFFQNWFIFGYWFSTKSWYTVKNQFLSMCQISELWLFFIRVKCIGTRDAHFLWIISALVQTHSATGQEIRRRFRNRYHNIVVPYM